MASVNRGVVEYKECDICREKSFKNFKQTNYENILSVSYKKPEVEQIIKVEGKTEILDYEFIKTPIGISLEGQELTGYKLLVNGNIIHKIQYLSKSKNNSVYTLNFTSPFCGCVALPRHFNTLSYVCPSALIEDIAIEQIDERCIYSNITLLLLVDIN